MGLRVIDEMLAGERDELLRRGHDEGYRDMLCQLVSKKFPDRELAVIRDRLREIKNRECLQGLLELALKDLTWEEFWNSSGR